MSLTKKELQEKIDRVEEDIRKLRANGAEEKKLMILTQYVDYLRDEYKLAKE